MSLTSDKIALSRPWKALSHGHALDAIRLAALLVLIGCGILTPGFMSRLNLLSLATASSFVGCVAIGMTFITLGGSVMSFSLGITLSSTTVVFINLLPAGVVAAAAAALVFSALIMAFQGWVIGTFRANPIIISLAALSLISGAATWATGGLGVYPEAGEADALHGMIGPIPLPLIAFIASTLIGQLIISRTRFGRNLIMVGSNPRAARVAGVNVWQTITGSYLIAGLFTGLTAILMAARYSSGDLELGTGYDYTAISAVLVGGTSIAGGKGSPLRTLFGALGIATIQALLILWGFSTQMQYLAIGLVVLLVIMLQAVEGGRP
ncbi:ABC transporter permease [Agrobacterium arsenijevicii]|uniref:ABC transporter permease n=1 Tax=Agrobacterium arsenijevicii TaxID=1585697 RepID=A0ABR5CYX7_9HYPH|nr:hypothetical protein RP75_28680 [Agrobacterium arsenijevicii]